MSTDDPQDHLDIESIDEPAAGEEISYQTFGEHFIRYLVTVPRLKGELEEALQATIEGSADALPNDLLVASYRFAPNEMDIERRVSDEAEVGFTLLVGGLLTLKLRVMSMTVALPMEVEIRIEIDVRTFAPLTIKLEPRKLRSRNVTVETRLPRELRRLPTKILDKVNPLVLAVTDNIVRQVNRRLEDPKLAKAATIDVLAIAEGSLGGGKRGD
ncbi:hypothetical protein [Algiphilus sp.]|uniref:hypothetical protein n=1 Tax=Algiphilus sp. TaxID=1872431 RepID=UPI003B52F756